MLRSQLVCRLCLQRSMKSFRVSPLAFLWPYSSVYSEALWSQQSRSSTEP